MVSIKRLGLAGSCTFSIGLISYTLGFPAMLKSQVKSQVRLKKGTEIRDFWEKLPQPLDFNIYIFNVTNPKEIESGAKPIVQEVGPFHYDLYRDKENVVDHDEDDSVEYSLKQVWHYNPEKSAVPEDTELIMFHPIMLSVVLITLRENPSALGVVKKALDSIFEKPESMFIKTTMKEIFFSGLRFDCTVKDFAGSAVCAALKEREHLFIREEEMIYRFGYLAKKNGSYMPERIRVYRGIKNHKDVGRLVSIGNKTKMDVWPGGPCNNFRGTDGTVFPPFLTKENVVWAHFPDICRSIGAFYVEPGVVQGFKTLRYTALLGDSSQEKDLKCLCLEPEGCMPKNMYDANPCIGGGMRISHPHFFQSDSRYLQMIEGLNPDPEKHAMTFEFDPMTGTPVKAYKKIQFNLLVEPVSKLKLMKNFPEALFPIFWIEDGVELGDVLQKPLKVAYKQIFIAKLVMWLMMLSGIGMMSAAGAIYYKEQGANNTSVPLPKSDGEQSETSAYQKTTVSVIQPNMLMPNVA